ncbi:MAG: GNAT family N-acetyltransferase [Clostridia bacterium]|nr:GNAT family N-acetyltransferase [Clostridia bacterium]
MAAALHEHPHEPVHVDRAVPADAEGILDVVRAAMTVYVRESRIPGVVDSLREQVGDVLSHIVQDAVFVARRGSRIVGTVRISTEPDGFAYLSRFAVLPGNQSLGIGSRLFDAAEAYMAEAGIHTVRLHTALTNRNLVRFYERKGFRLVGSSDDRGYPRGLFIKEF